MRKYVTCFFKIDGTPQRIHSDGAQDIEENSFDDAIEAAKDDSGDRFWIVSENVKMGHSNPKLLEKAMRN